MDKSISREDVRLGSMAYGAMARSDARMISDVLTRQFLQASRRELRQACNIDSSRLYRALLELERRGILLAEYRGKLALAKRIYGSRKW